MPKEKLKIGLLLNSYQTDAWMYKVIEKIHQSSYAEISLAVINANGVQKKSSPKKENLLSKIIKNRGRILSLATRKFLEQIYRIFIERRIILPNAFEKVDLSPILENIPIVIVDPIKKKWSDSFGDQDIEIIKSYNIDIFIRAGFRILRGEILSSSKYGIWSFHHGDNTVNRGGPAGFWESLENWAETGSILQILTEDLDNGIVLFRSYSATNRRSYNDNRNTYFWKSLSFMTRRIEDLHRMGEKEFFKEIDTLNQHPQFYSNRLYRAPTNSELASLIFKKSLIKIKNVANNKLFFDQWILMYDLKDTFSSSLWRYKKIIPPKDRFWADPHVVYRDNKYYIYIEEFLHKTMKGHISLIVMDENGEYAAPQKILDKPYHLSYPFIFEHEGKLYMIPETSSNNTIELFECSHFPDRWEFKMNLMEDVIAFDATLYYYNSKWWMFVNIVENVGACSDDELFLFYSDELQNKNWIPHPRNPIISDCKSARPAGKIFEKNGRMYRPSQNCSVQYGYGFNISHIELLNENEYEEIIVSKVYPNWDKDIIATHSYNRTNSLHIIDAKMKRWR